MIATTGALIIYCFIDLIFEFNSDALAYISLSGLAGYTINQSVVENKNEKV